LLVVWLILGLLRGGLLELGNIDGLLNLSIFKGRLVSYYPYAVGLCYIGAIVLLALHLPYLLLFAPHSLKSITSLLFEKGHLVAAFETVFFIPAITRTVSANEMGAFGVDVVVFVVGMAEIALYHFLI
jgi:hypothetical protein